MSKLLLDEQPLLVMPQLAAKIGLNEAIILQQLHYWLEINKKTNNNFREGHYWAFNSYEDWQKQFPFWSSRTIQRAITILEKMRLVVTANYNKLQIDRTKWYRIDYEVLETLESSPFGQIGTSNMTAWHNHLDSLSSPLPETNTKTKTETNNIMDFLKNKKSALTFWDYCKLYPVKPGTTEAVDYYLDKYRSKMGKDHPKLKPGQWERVSGEFLTAYDDKTGISFDLGLADVRRTIDHHFVTKYKDCDYNILHFAESRVKANRMYEAVY